MTRTPLEIKLITTLRSIANDPLCIDRIARIAREVLGDDLGPTDFERLSVAIFGEKAGQQ